MTTDISAWGWGGSQLGVGLCAPCTIQLARSTRCSISTAIRGASIWRSICTAIRGASVICFYVRLSVSLFLLPPERAPEAGPCHLFFIHFDFLPSFTFIHSPPPTLYKWGLAHYNNPIHWVKCSILLYTVENLLLL